MPSPELDARPPTPSKSLAVRIAPAPPWPKPPSPRHLSPARPTRRSMTRRFTPPESRLLLQVWLEHKEMYDTGVRSHAISKITAALNARLDGAGYSRKQVENKIGYLCRRYRQVCAMGNLEASGRRRFALFEAVQGVIGGREGEMGGDRDKGGAEGTAEGAEMVAGDGEEGENTMRGTKRAADGERETGGREGRKPRMLDDERVALAKAELAFKERELVFQRERFCAEELRLLAKMLFEAGEREKALEVVAQIRAELVAGEEERTNG